MIAITADRVKNLISGAKTEQEITFLLRSHKIRFSFSTDTGFLSIRIPCRKGYIRIYRTCSRSVPFAVRLSSPFPFYPVHVHNYDI